MRSMREKRLKGRSLTVRLRQDLGERLEVLSAATERSKTLYLEKCLEAHLPALEKRYERELKEFHRRGYTSRGGSYVLNDA